MTHPPPARLPASGWVIAARLAVLPCLLLSSCAPVRAAGAVARGTGRAVVGTVTYTGKAVVAAGRATGATVRFFTGTRTVRLEKEGSSYYVRAVINRKAKVRLVLDTGASAVQLSLAAARRAGIDPSRGDRITCTLADGSSRQAVSGKVREVAVGGASAEAVPVVILDSSPGPDCDGLLGMSFLGGFNFRVDTEQDLLVLKYKD